MGKKKSDIKYAAKQVLNRTENQEIPTMDTSKSTDTLGSQILGNTMEGLYRLDKDNKPIPAAAESSTKSEDGKKYTFKLRKDAKWSNGDPVTAKDFVLHGSAYLIRILRQNMHLLLTILKMQKQLIKEKNL